jgi:hypothetical protein
MRAFGALDPRLLANPPDPLVPARRRIAGPAGPAAHEPARIDVLAPAKERTEQGDFVFNRGIVAYRAGMGIGQDSQVHG